MTALRALADWRIVGILVVVGAGVALFAPNLIATVFPLLIVAACPLSMVVMMRSMGGRDPGHAPGPTDSRDTRALLRDRLVATQLEQLQIQQELARLDDADGNVAGDGRRPGATADAPVRPS